MLVNALEVDVFPMKLGLGTVEFAAKSGKHAFQVPVEEVRRILAQAEKAGIHLLDTSSEAGNSEEIIGACLSPEQSFDIITKTPSMSADGLMPPSPDQLEQMLRNTLQQLNRPQVYGYMINIGDGLLNHQGERLFRRMEALKSQGLAQKVGISVSTAEEIDWVLSRFKPDIVQLPLSVMDQRLWASGHLKLLKKKNIEIHARDVFLQGVLLDPLHLHPWFWPLRKQMEQYHDFLIHEGLTPLEGALSFVTALPEVDYALVGVQSSGQLGEIVGAFSSGVAPDDFAPFACRDARFLDPLQWNLYE